MPIEQGDQFVATGLLIGNRRPPYPVALIPVEIEEKFMETRNQVDLGEKHVDRRKHLQLLGQLLDALTQALGQIDRETGRIAHQLANAHGHDDAVDGRPWPVLFQQTKKTEPFLAIFLVD